MPGGIRTRNLRSPLILRLRPARAGEGPGRSFPSALFRIELRASASRASHRGGRWESNPLPRVHRPVLYPHELRPPRVRSGHVFRGWEPAEALRLRPRWSRLHREPGASRPAGPAPRVRLFPVLLVSPVVRPETRIAPPTSSCAGGARCGRSVWGRWVRLRRGAPRSGPPALLLLRILHEPADRRARCGVWAHCSPRRADALLPAGARQCAREPGMALSVGEAVPHGAGSFRPGTRRDAGSRKRKSRVRCLAARAARRGASAPPRGSGLPNDHRDATPRARSLNAHLGAVNPPVCPTADGGLVDSAPEG